MAATYGSLSIGTFVLGTEFLARQHSEFGVQAVAVTSLMESPAVITRIVLVGIFAFRVEGGSATARVGLRSILHESFCNGTVPLLVGSLVIGVITGKTASEGLRRFMYGIFQRFAMLLLLDVGTLAARKAGTLIEAGLRLAAFGIVAWLANAALVIGIPDALGLNQGEALLFTLLCANSSY